MNNISSMRNVFLKLFDLLESNCYREAIDALTGGRIARDPWAPYLVEKLDSLPEAQSWIIRLFHQGIQVEINTNVIEYELLEGLKNLKIIKSHPNGRISLGGRTIVPYLGYYFFSDIWRPGTEVTADKIWLGEDSLYLAQTLPNARNKKVLDLCSGTGIQSIILASRGAKVTAVELNEKAVELALWNTYINGVDDSVTVVQGNLYDPVQNEKFDIIISIPPFLPLVQDKDERFLFADGGEDGTEVLQGIIDELHNRLEMNGCAKILAGSYGNESKPAIVNVLTKKASSIGGITIDLMVLGKNSLQKERAQIEAKFPFLKDRIMVESTLGQLKVSHYYTFLLSVRKGDGKSSLKETHYHSDLRDLVMEMRKRRQSI
ncbi:HemK2/MTQ2 family protein methyltransferase [Bacillus cereus]|uniref:HemK2/MTQ2 family protein methyltransferase n=1 Tax=Bacillus cereus TaxID=1396 RepID=UPI00141958D3|nr:HemK2/MTQ2 family protein methyltransferase [Bacillus cereus]